MCSTQLGSARLSSIPASEIVHVSETTFTMGGYIVHVMTFAHALLQVM